MTTCKCCHIHHLKFWIFKSQDNIWVTLLLLIHKELKYCVLKNLEYVLKLFYTLSKKCFNPLETKEIVQSESDFIWVRLPSGIAIPYHFSISLICGFAFGHNAWILFSWRILALKRLKVFALLSIYFL